ncbi:MAG: O-antigen polymerase [Pseudarthrobacter sp.]|nr:O-antigen polymerase [Pseudarthrobacter sp.]
MAGDRVPAATVSISLVCASVLAFQPGGHFRFVWAKLLFLVVAVLVGIFSPAEGRLPRVIKLMLVVGAGWIAVAMLLSDTPLASLAGRWPRYEGILTIALYLAVFGLGARLLGRNAVGGSWRSLRLGLSVVAVMLAFVSALEAAGLRPLGGGPDVRPGAFLGNATDQGLIGVVIAGVLAAPHKEPTAAQTWVRTAGFGSAALVVFLSASRAALAGLAVVVMVAAVLWVRNRAVHSTTQSATRLPLMLVALPAAVLLALAGAALLLPPTRARLFSAGTIDGRWLLWDRTWNLVLDHLWTGVGPSGFVDVLPAYLDRVWAESVGDGFPTDSPHNWPLQLLVAGGVPLLVVAAVSAILFLRLAVETMRKAPDLPQRQHLAAALVAVVAYSLALLTHFTSPGTTGLVAFISGGLVAADLNACARPAGAPAAARRLSRAAGVAMAAAGLAVAIPAAAAEWPMAAGVRAAGVGDMAGAEAAFDAAHLLRPWDSDTSLLAAQAYAGPATSGNPAAAAGAVKWGNRALERTPQSLEAGTAAAIGSLYSGDVAGAKDRLDGLAARAPASAGVLVQRGVANFGLGRAAESIADLQKAASLDPSSDTPWLVLAGVYERLGDETNAGNARLRARQLAAG